MTALAQCVVHRAGGERHAGRVGEWYGNAG